MTTRYDVIFIGAGIIVSLLVFKMVNMVWMILNVDFNCTASFFMRHQSHPLSKS